MIVTCPSCNARYLVDAAKIGPTGRTVKCAKCAHSWLQAPGEEEPEATAPPPAGDDAAAFAAPPDAPDETTDDDTGFGRGDDAVPPVREPAFESALRATREGSNLPALPRKRRRWPAALAWLLLLAVVAGVVGGAAYFRDEVVAALPAAKPIYDFVGLSPPALGARENTEGAAATTPAKPLGVAKVDFKLNTVEGAEVLTIEGEIVNPDRLPQDVPDLRVLFLDESGEVIRKWSFPPPARTIAAETALRFSTRMSAPPRNAKRIDVGLDVAPDATSSQ